MARRYGIDVSHFQNPAAPGGVPWAKLREKSDFVLVRATYGTWPDPNTVAHVKAARATRFDLTLYHFLVVTQPVSAQLDVFCAQAAKAGVGKGDIVPAIDLEDDGKNKLTPALAPLIQSACETLVSEFGGLLTYITQAGWAALGKPAWLLEYFQWTAHYTNAPKPATPGNVAPTIWQNRVGLYNPGAPFVEKEAFLGNALDQDVCDVDLPRATMDPTHPAVLPDPGPPPPSHPELWANRLAAQALAGLDLSHDAESGEAYNS